MKKKIIFTEEKKMSMNLILSRAYRFLSPRPYREWEQEIRTVEQMCIRLKNDHVLDQMKHRTEFRWRGAIMDWLSSSDRPIVQRMLPIRLFRDMIATMHRTRSRYIYRDHVRYRPAKLSPVRKRVGIVAMHDSFFYLCENRNTGTIHILA